MSGQSLGRNPISCSEVDDFVHSARERGLGRILEQDRTIIQGVHGCHVCVFRCHEGSVLGCDAQVEMRWTSDDVDAPKTGLA